MGEEIVLMIKSINSKVQFLYIKVQKLHFKH